MLRKSEFNFKMHSKLEYRIKCSTLNALFHLSLSTCLLHPWGAGQGSGLVCCSRCHASERSAKLRHPLSVWTLKHPGGSRSSRLNQRKEKVGGAEGGMFIQVPWIHARLDEFAFHPAVKRTFILGDPCLQLQGGVCLCVCVCVRVRVFVCVQESLQMCHLRVFV